MSYCRSAQVHSVHHMLTSLWRPGTTAAVGIGAVRTASAPATDPAPFCPLPPGFFIEDSSRLARSMVSCCSLSHWRSGLWGTGVPFENLSALLLKWRFVVGDFNSALLLLLLAAALDLGLVSGTLEEDPEALAGVEEDFEVV
jgi:hypothetical protein